LVNIIEFYVVPRFKDPNLLHRKYVVEKLSLGEVAKLLFSSKATIAKHLKLNGIPLREPGKSIRRRRGLAYGQRVVDRAEVDHKREGALIQKMAKLRQSGLSYHKIANILNTWNIPTKTRRGKWSGKQVHQILKRLKLIG
jgi:hypothetical protein